MNITKLKTGSNLYDLVLNSSIYFSIPKVVIISFITFKRFVLCLIQKDHYFTTILSPAFIHPSLNTLAKIPSRGIMQSPTSFLISHP